MLDLEELGGGGLCAAYAILLDVMPDGEGHLLVADYEGSIVTIPAPPGTAVPVITYGISNMLETDPSRRPS